MDIREHARAIREQREQLDLQFPSGCLFVTTVANRMKNTTAGAISEVSTANAATGLVEGTLRIATDSEVESYQKRMADAREFILRGREARYPRPLAVTVERR
jgi:hypothetical protein